MKLRLVADGSVQGTRVIDVDTARVIGNVRSVDFHHGAGDIPRVTLELQCIPAELSGGTVRYIVPGIGYIRAVELEDGTRVELPLLVDPGAPR